MLTLASSLTLQMEVNILLFFNPKLNFRANRLYFIICPIAIACSMGQIRKPVFLCSCVHLRALSCLHFLMDFHQNWHRHKKPKSKNDFVVGKHRTTPSPILPPKTDILGKEVLKIHANINNNHITVLNVRESPKFPRLTGNVGRGT